jgi:DNA-3-methyladenine glycosylase II
MPTTRSSARLAIKAITQSSASGDEVQPGTHKKMTRKRTNEDIPGKIDGKKKARKTEVIVGPVPAQAMASLVVEASDITAFTERDTDTIVPAVLTFSLDEAKRHIIGVDNRFEDIFKKLACKPFENLEGFHPFQYA